MEILTNPPKKARFLLSYTCSKHLFEGSRCAPITHGHGHKPAPIARQADRERQTPPESQTTHKPAPANPLPALRFLHRIRGINQNRPAPWILSQKLNAQNRPARHMEPRQNRLNPPKDQKVNPAKNPRKLARHAQKQKRQKTCKKGKKRAKLTHRQIA